MDKIDHSIGFLAIDWLQWSEGRFDEERAEIALKYISQLKSENQKLKEAAAVLVEAVTSTWVGEYGKVINRHNAEKLKK